MIEDPVLYCPSCDQAIPPDVEGLRPGVVCACWDSCLSMSVVTPELTLRLATADDISAQPIRVQRLSIELQRLRRLRLEGLQRLQRWRLEKQPLLFRSVPMEHDEVSDSAHYPSSNTQLGIPYPFSDLPPADEPFTATRMVDTLDPLLAQIAGLAEVLHETDLANVSHDHLSAVHSLLAAHTKAARAIFRRWWNDRQDD